MFLAAPSCISLAFGAWTIVVSRGEAWNSDLSNEKRALGWLGYIGDEQLPSYIGIIISHYKDPD